MINLRFDAVGVFSIIYQPSVKVKTNTLLR